jgi:hypothetical protein
MNDITSALASLNVPVGTSITEAVKNVRTYIQGDLDPIGELARAYTVAEALGVVDPASILGDKPQRARLFATSLVASALAVPTRFDVKEAIDTAIEKVANLEKMGVVSKGTKEPKAKVEKPVKAPKVTQGTKAPRAPSTHVNLAQAIAIYQADPGTRVYDLVTRVAEAYNVDRNKAYSILHRARKAA